MKWYKIEGENLDNEQSIQKIKVNGKSICLVKTEDNIFACASKCPHAGADISQGWVDENCQIVCPFHRHKYSLENGRGAPGQGDYIEIYPVERRMDGTYIKLSENWLKSLFKK
jgi:nitrite reductase/ring-hydroxylating ferredoxin subunit